MNTRFKPGDGVRVRINHTTGHCRTPHFVQGKTGMIAAVHGAFPNPEHRAYGGNGLPFPVLYQVRFRQTHLWSDYPGPEADTLHIDLFEHWLEKMDPEEYDFSGGIRGKHAKAYRQGHMVKINKVDGTVETHYFTPGDGTIMLDPDVKKHFPDSESVNKALRSLIAQR